MLYLYCAFNLCIFTACLTSPLVLKHDNGYVPWNCGLTLKEMEQKDRAQRIDVIRISHLGD